MFKKWFSRLKSPSKSGSHSGDQHFEGGRFAKVFELELSNMEGVPSYQLTHQLTIGSEIGNIVIADPSVSPRHATFILQQDVVSVIDHSSVTGTFVNGKKVSAGKYIILEESDVIAVGDLEVRIKVKEEPFPEESESEEPPSPEELPAYEPAKPAGEIQLDEIKNPQLTSQTPKQKDSDEKKIKTFKVQSTAGASSGSVETVSPAKKKKKKFSLRFKSYHAANTLVRILAITGDLILAYVLVEILYPFDDFKQFISYVPETFFTLLDIQPDYLWITILSDYPEIRTFWEEFSNLITDVVLVAPILISFLFIRLSSTLLIGVSVSEFMFGMRAQGNGVWNRIGGVIRVVLGIFTGPFLIFDLPAIVSRRTFKEFMTFTNTDAYSKSLTTAGIVFYFPLLVVLVLLSPLFQGLDIIEPISVTTVIDKRVKAAEAKAALEADVTLPQQTPEASAEVVVVPEPVFITDGSKQMGLGLSYAQADQSLIPSFKFTGGKVLKYQSSVNFFIKELQRPVQVEVFKTFDLKQLVGLGLKGNFMLFGRFPELYSFSHEPTDKSFAKVMTSQAQETFAKEFIEYTKLALGLTLENAVEVAQTQTFIFKNLVDFRAALLSLLEYKDFSQLGLAHIGDTIFLRASYSGAKPFDLIIPLKSGPGKVFKVTYDKRLKLKDLSSKFYKFMLEKATWLSPTYPVTAEKFTALETYDFFSTLNVKDRASLALKAKLIYGFYFELAADVLKRNEPVEYAILKKSVDDVTKIYQLSLAPTTTSPLSEDENTLLKNFNELKDAVGGRNLGFFGLEQSI